MRALYAKSKGMPANVSQPHFTLVFNPMSVSFVGQHGRRHTLKSAMVTEAKDEGLGRTAKPPSEVKGQSISFVVKAAS